MAALTIQLTGGPPWGFRLHGGRGQNIPLTVAKVSEEEMPTRCAPAHQLNSLAMQTFPRFLTEPEK